MIGQYLSNTNENATVSILQKILELNNRIANFQNRWERSLLVLGSRSIKIQKAWTPEANVRKVTSSCRSIAALLSPLPQSQSPLKYNQPVLASSRITHGAPRQVPRPQAPNPSVLRCRFPSPPGVGACTSDGDYDDDDGRRPHGLHPPGHPRPPHARRPPPRGARLPPLAPRRHPRAPTRAAAPRLLLPPQGPLQPTPDADDGQDPPPRRLPPARRRRRRLPAPLPRPHQGLRQHPVHPGRPPRPRAPHPSLAPQVAAPAPHPRRRPGVAPPRPALAAAARRGARARGPLAPRKVRHWRRRPRARAPEQPHLRRRLAHRRRRPPARLGRVRPRRHLRQLPRAAEGRGRRRRLRPVVVRGPLRARRWQHLLAHLQLQPRAPAGSSHDGLVLHARACRPRGSLQEVPRRRDAGGRPSVHRVHRGRCESADLGAWRRRRVQVERQGVVAAEGDLHDQSARHRAWATQGQDDADALHLAQRHGLRSHREGVHLYMGIWALLVPSGDRQAGALGDERWQGAWRPYLCLHLGMAASVPRCSKKLTFWLLTSERR